MNDLLPTAAVVSAAGVALLLCERGPRLRLLGIALAVAGLAPLVSHQAPSLQDTLARHPAAAGAGAAGLAGLIVVLVAAALRWPWFVPVVGAVVALRFALANPIRPLHYLVPLFCVLVAGLVVLVWRTIRRQVQPPAIGLIGPLLSAHLLLAAVSLYWTAELSNGVFEITASYLPLGILAALIAHAAPRERFLATLPALQIVVALGLAVVAIYEWFAQHNLVDNAKLDLSNAYKSVWRVNSLLYDPSIFARVEALALVTIVGLALLARGRVAILAAALVAPVIFIGMLFSFSQTSFAALGAGLAVLVAIAWRRVVAALAIVAVLALAVSVAIAQPQVMRVIDRSVNTASSSRVSLAERGSETFLAHPVAGVGLGGFAQATRRNASERTIAPHNVAIHIASELGSLGLLLFVSTLATIVISLRRLANRAVAAILGAELVTLVVHGLAYDQFFSDPTWWTIAALAGSLSPVAGRLRIHLRSRVPESVGAPEPPCLPS